MSARVSGLPLETGARALPLRAENGIPASLAEPGGVDGFAGQDREPSPGVSDSTRFVSDSTRSVSAIRGGLARVLTVFIIRNVMRGARSF